MAKRPLTGQHRQHPECDRQDHRTTGLVLVQHGLPVDLELQAGGKPGGLLSSLGQASLTGCVPQGSLLHQYVLFVRVQGREAHLPLTTHMASHKLTFLPATRTQHTTRGSFLPDGNLLFLARLRPPQLHVITGSVPGNTWAVGGRQTEFMAALTESWGTNVAARKGPSRKLWRVAMNRRLSRALGRCG